VIEEEPQTEGDEMKRRCEEHINNYLIRSLRIIAHDLVPSPFRQYPFPFLVISPSLISGHGWDDNFNGHVSIYIISI
jgi:hypothetical protein